MHSGFLKFEPCLLASLQWGASDIRFRGSRPGYYQGVGFRVQDSGFRVQGVRFRVQGVGFRVQGSGRRVQGVLPRRVGPEKRQR